MERVFFDPPPLFLEVIFLQVFFRKRRILFITPLLTGIFLFLQVQPAIAGYDLEAVLRSWFDKKQLEAIEKIDAAINHEKEKQIERIQSYIKKEMTQVEAELAAFTDAEIEKRVARIKEYADEIILHNEFNDEKKKGDILKELDQIVQRAVAEMEQVRAKLNAPEESKNERNYNMEEG